MNYVFMNCPDQGAIVDIYYENSFRRKWSKTFDTLPCDKCKLHESLRIGCASHLSLIMPEGILCLDELVE